MQGSVRQTVDSTPKAPVSQQFPVDSVSDKSFGPILKSGFDEWVS
jgi:hypothetical protein